MSNKIKFEPVGIMETPFGTIFLGKDGTLLYRAADCHTGEETTVVLSSGIKDTQTLSQGLTMLAKHMGESADTEPSGVSFHELMSSITKH